MTSIGPPFVVGLVSVTATTMVVMALVLFVLRKGWWGYRGLIIATAFTVLAFWALRGLLNGAFLAAWNSLGARASVEAILGGGLVLSVVAIFALAVMIRRTAAPVWNREV